MTNQFEPEIEDTHETVELQRRAKRTTWFSNAMKRLQPGQSFFIPEDMVCSAGYLRNRAYDVSRRLGYKVTVKKDQKDGKEGFRVHRLTATAR